MSAASLGPAGHDGVSLFPLTVRHYDAYDQYIAVGKTATAYMGPRVAVVIDHACKDAAALAAANLRAMAAMIYHLEKLLAAFDDAVGKRPELNAPLEGRVRIETAFIDAAGLASHGVAGIATGPAFLESTLKSHIESIAAEDSPAAPDDITALAASAGGTFGLGLPAFAKPPALHHVYTYETCRNYIFPDEFTPVFDYRLAEGPDCWGWVNQGFINVMGCLLLADCARAGSGLAAAAGATSAATATSSSSTTGAFASDMGATATAATGGAAASSGSAPSAATATAAATPAAVPASPAPAAPASASACSDSSSSIAFDYFGRDGPSFMDSMTEHLEAYAGGTGTGDLCWKDVFYHERLPWNKDQSLDNLYSGLLIQLWREHGRKRFLRRWFRGAIPTLLSRCPADKDDFVTARDNFFLAACYAAGADLTDFFEGVLRWPISDGARGDALEVVLATAACDEL